MNRFKTFITFIFLVALWASFFATIKFFLWGELADGIQPDLQKIAGYLSLGGIFAYLIGGAFASTFLKKYYLFVIAILSLIFVSIGYFVGFSSHYFFAFVVTFIGFLYGLWNVVKSVLISIEIKKTGLPETLVNALVGITFVVFIIIGSLLGNILFEKMGHEGYLVIMSVLAVISVISFSLDYDKIAFSSLIENGWGNYIYERKLSLAKSMKMYIPDMKYIIKNYLFIIVTSSLLWAISTIVSQASVEFSVSKFEIEASKATYVLLFSALGAIIGNFLSVKMNTKRWGFFIIFNSLFGLVIILFPFLAISFSMLSFMAIILGMFFGVSANLIDSFLLKKIGDENKKEYGASTFGLIFSMIIFSMMFISSHILTQFGYATLMVGLGVVVLLSGSILYSKSSKMN